MKIFGELLSLSLLTVCMAAAGAPLVTVDMSRAKSVATASIQKKYPDIKTEDLKFDGMQYSKSVDGVEKIRISYALPASTTQKDQGTNSIVHITRIKTIDVELSNDGKVENVSKGEKMSYATEK